MPDHAPPAPQVSSLLPVNPTVKTVRLVKRPTATAGVAPPALQDMFLSRAGPAQDAHQAIRQAQPMHTVKHARPETTTPITTPPTVYSVTWVTISRTRGRRVACLVP